MSIEARFERPDWKPRVKHPREAPMACWVYVLECGDLVKIGSAVDVARRMAEIKRDPDKRRATLAYKEQCLIANAHLTEKVVHAYLGDKRIGRSDWFHSVNLEFAIFVVQEAFDAVRSDAA